MNKIFKVIWNHTAQRFDVVSELTKSNGKSSSTTDNRVEPSKALLAISVAGAALLGSASAMAAVAVQKAQDLNGKELKSVGDYQGNLNNKFPIYMSMFPGSTAGYADIILIGNNTQLLGTTGSTTIIGANASGGAVSTVIGAKAVALGEQDVVIGSGAEQRNTSPKSYSTAIGREAIVGEKGEVAVSIGYKALANNSQATAIGGEAVASGAAGTAIGYKANATGGSSLAMGFGANATASNTVALGVGSVASAFTAFAGGSEAKALKSYSIAIGAKSEANADESAIAIGQSAGVSDGSTSGLALGGAAKVNGVRGVAIGRSVHANGTYSVGIGTGTAVRGAGSSTVGYSNVIGSTSSEVSAFGSKNLIGATAKFNSSAGDGITDSRTIADAAAVTNSKVVGNNNYISSSNTYVLGSGVGVKDDGTSFMGTVENSVYLGNDSTIKSSDATIDATTAGTVKNLDTNGDAGATSTAGSKGTVKSAKVSDITYGTFAGATSVGAVSVGAAGSERRIVNMAAGEISATSTDAINGSQLYAVAAEVAKGFNVTSSDGTSNVNILPGENVQFVNGTLTTANVNNLANGGASVTFDVDKGTFNAPDNGKLVANPADTGVATVADVANAVNAGYWKVGNKDGVVNNVNFGDDVRFLNGTNTTVTVAADTTDRTNITIDTDFSKLPTLNTTTANITNNGGTISVDVNMGEGSVNGDGVASVNNGDANKVANISNVVKLVNEAGWNIFKDNDASANKKDLVVAGDNVVFAAGTNTTVSVETTNGGKTTTVKYDVDLSNVNTAVANTSLTVENGKVSPPAEGDKLVNATTVANAINQSGFTLKSSAAEGTKVSGDDEVINPGDVVDMVAGKNMTVKQEKDGKITYATAEDVDFNTVTLSNGTEPSVKLVNEAAVPASNNDVANAPTTALNITSTDGKPTQITGVGSVLNTTPVGTNVNTGGKVTPGTSPLVNLTGLADNILNSAATVRDLANMGWVVSTETGGYKDTVKNANEVKFVAGSERVSVTGETNATTGVREITIDLAKVKAAEVTDPTAQLTDADGDVNFADTNTTNVTVNPKTGVVTVDVKTTKLTPTGKGNITEPADATEGAKLVNATTVANAINKSGWNAKSGGYKADGDMADATLINPSEEVTFSAGKNLTVKRVNNEFTFATAADVDFNRVTVGNDGDKITIGNVGGKNVVGNLDTTITKPTTSNNPAAKPTGDALNNAATLGDVLNAGWNLQENGNAKDVVTPYDAVNFVNGAGSSVKVESDGTVSKVVYNVNVDGKTTEYTYIDDKGNKLTAETQPDGTVVYKDEKGAIYTGPVTSRVSAILPTTTVDGKEVGGDITFGDTTTANVTTNDAGDIVVNVNTGDSNATKDGKATALTDKQGNPVNKVVAADGSVTYTDEDGKPVAADDVVDSTEKVATVGDIVDTINKTGWKATSGKVGTGIVSGTNEELISPSDVVTFQAGDNMVLTQVGKVFTYSVNPDPVFNTTTAKAGMTIGEGDTAVNMTPTTANVVNGDDVNGKVTPAVDMNGATFTNISSNLPNTTSVGNNPTTTGPITAQEAADLAKTSGSNAATLNDVLNAGWTLQENDNAKDFVKPFDTVNFKDGKGTTANITSDGSVSNVNYSVNVDNTTTEITYVSTDAKGNNTKVYLQADGSYNTARDGSGTKVDADTIKGSQVSAILPTFNGNSTAGNVNFANSTTADINYNNATGNVTVDVKTGTSSVSDGKAKDAEGNTIAAGKAVADTTNGTVATIADVVDTINSVYHSVASTKVADTNGESYYKVTEESKIGAGDVVNYNAGQNIKISGEGNNINISTTENVTFTNANVTNNLTVDGNTTVNNFTVKPNSTIDMGNNIIGNVEAGVKGTDAVNVSQLNATKDAFNWKVTGNNNASNATAVGNQTVSFNNGAGTTAVVDGTNVTYNVNVDGKTTQITYTDADGNTVTKNADGTYTKANGDVVEAANVTSQVSVAFGNVAANPTTGTAEGDISPRVASTGDVANAINGSGWKTTDKDGNTLLVNPGDTVDYVNGNGTTANVTKTTGADGKDVVSVTFDVKTAAETTTNANGSIAAPTDGANFVNATTLVNTVNNASWNVNAGAVEGSTGQSTYTAGDKVKAGDTVTINAGNNIIVSGSGKTINVATSTAPTFTTVQVGGSTGPVIGADENGDVKVSKADGSAAKITNVAAGTADTDAVNVGQLKQVAGDIHNKINRNNKDLRAGIAGANAAAGLPQVYIPGKSMVAASAGTFKGQSAVAVGYSRASDNGKLILKLQGNANTRGDIGGSVGVGYQW